MCHPVEPELVGKNLMDFHDMNGKRVVQYVTDVGRKPEKDASGWVFYLWADKTQLIPRWKSAYIRKVITPGPDVHAGHDQQGEGRDTKIDAANRLIGVIDPDKLGNPQRHDANRNHEHDQAGDLGRK